MQKARKVFGILRIILRALLIAVIALLAAYNVYMLVQRYVYRNGMPKVFGVATAVVASGSMAPEINIGDLVVVKEADDYKVGEVITFYDTATGTYITHRVILVNGDKFTTMGDANDSQDTPISKSVIVGKVVNVLHGAGKAIAFFQSPAGLFTVIAAGVVIWGVADVIAILLNKKDKADSAKAACVLSEGKDKENEDEQERD